MTKCTERINIRVSPEQKEKYLLIGGAKTIKKILDEVDVKPKSKSLSKSSSTKKASKPNINTSLINQLIRIRTNINQIGDRLVFLENKHERVKRVLELENLLEQKINMVIELIKSNPLNIEFVNYWIKALKAIGKKINDSAKIINRKKLIEIEEFTKQDEEKILQKYQALDELLEGLASR